MPHFLVRCTLFCGIVVAMLPGTTLAEERLVMPFSCQSIAGRVVLNPAPPQTYRIFGAPEHQRFTACSPNRPDLCRDWMVHRFDLDCNGTKVSWLTVIDALTKMGPGRTSVSNGRLHVRMGPWWNGGPPGPCDMRPRFAYGPWGYGRPAYGWPCQRSSLDGREPTIDMPTGFAPFPGPFARFISAPDATPTAAASLGGAAQYSDAGQGRATEPVAPAAKVASPAAAAVQRTKTTAADRASSPSTATTAASKTDSAEATASLPQKRVTTPPQGSEGTDQVDLEQTPAIGVGMGRLSWPQLGLGLAIGLLLASLFALLRRGESIGAEIAESRPTATGPSFASEPVAPRPSTPRRVLTDEEWLPSTRSEALHVLGASSETAQDMLKTMVRTLRQTWHPDLASQDDERRIRGLRLKQINVAWDILCGKRASA
jgi:hypothetical protein